MIAYNRQSLDNLEIQQQANEALEKGLLTTEEIDRIRKAYPIRFYLPNSFIGAGLFLLTVLATVCAFGLFLLFGLDEADHHFGMILILFGVIGYGALELFIRHRKMYRAGVDDALLWMAGLSVTLGVYSGLGHPSPTLLSLTVLLLAAGGVLRYTDRLMALVAYGALLSLLFYTVTGWGAVARALLPFMTMAVSIGLYLVFTRWITHDRLRHYHSSLVLLRAATLLSFYLGGNYYIIRELNAAISEHPGPVALGWLWWLLTGMVPILYIARGIQKKDVVFLWTGMALVAATVFTVRYYYHLLPAELAMIIAGCVLIAGVYGLTRYLRTPKHGFTSAAPDYPHALADLPMEGMILAESFTSVAAQPADPGVRFGGGTTGGGGAGGNY